MSVSSRRAGSRAQSHGGMSNQNLPSLKNLRKQLRHRYNDKTMTVVKRYIEEMELSAEIINNINYLRRCRDLRLIPKEYWMVCLTYQIELFTALFSRSIFGLFLEQSRRILFPHS